MGDPLSSAALRLFKWVRETACSKAGEENVVRYKNSRSQLVRLQGCNVVFLDVYFRDDLRHFAMWDSTSSLSAAQVRVWARRRAQRRYDVGTMLLESAEVSEFIGLNTVFTRGRLDVWVRCPDPWAIRTYGLRDACTLKPWASWAPLQQRAGVVRNLLSRCFYFANSGAGRVRSYSETLSLLLSCVGFPMRIIRQEAERWAMSFRPKSMPRHCAEATVDSEEIRTAIRRVEHEMCTVRE